MIHKQINSTRVRQSCSETTLCTEGVSIMDQIKSVAYGMGEAIKQLRAQVNAAMRLSDYAEKRSRLRLAHRQLSWLVPLQRSLVALSQQSAHWVSPDADAPSAKACIKCIEGLEREIRSFRYSDPDHFGPIGDVPLLRARKGVAPSDWPVMTLAEFVAQERESIERVSEHRRNALLASEDALNRFLASLQPEQQALLRESMSHAASAGSYNLTLNMAHFRAMGVAPVKAGLLMDK